MKLEIAETQYVELGYSAHIDFYDNGRIQLFVNIEHKVYSVGYGIAFLGNSGGADVDVSLNRFLVYITPTNDPDTEKAYAALNQYRETHTSLGGRLTASAPGITKETLPQYVTKRYWTWITSTDTIAKQ